MIPIALTLLTFLTRPADSLPDGKTIDSLTYSFTDPESRRSEGSLAITTDGKVRYRYKPSPIFPSRGKAVTADWEIPKAEAAGLFRKLVEDGLLELSDNPF